MHTYLSIVLALTLCLFVLVVYRNGKESYNQACGPNAVNQICPGKQCCSPKGCGGSRGQYDNDYCNRDEEGDYFSDTEFGQGNWHGAYDGKQKDLAAECENNDECLSNLCSFGTCNTLSPRVSLAPWKPAPF